MDFTQFAKALQANVAQVIVGKAEATELLLVTLLCEGHVLIEDVPGVGKTMLAQGAGPQPGRLVPPHPVHARPAALRRDRAEHLQPEDAGVRVPPGPIFATSCWRTRSTAPRRAPSRRCWRRCRSAR